MSNLSLAYEVIVKMLEPLALAATVIGGLWGCWCILTDRPIIQTQHTPTYVCYRHSIGAHVRSIPFDEEPSDA